MSTGNLYQQLPGNPFLRKALAPQASNAERLVWATLAQAYEPRTLVLQQIEAEETHRRRHNNFSTPANRDLENLRTDIQTRTNVQDNDND